MAAFLLIVASVAMLGQKLFPDPQKRGRIEAVMMITIGVLFMGLIGLGVAKELRDKGLRHRSERLMDRVPIALKVRQR